MYHVHLYFNSIVQFHQLGLNMMDQADTDDIAAAAQVTDWLTEGLPPVLPNGVKPNLSKLALAGHSRGGHTAFSLVLGHGKTNLSSPPSLASTQLLAKTSPHKSHQKS